MNLDELVRQHANLLVVAGGIRGKTLLETALRVFCVVALKEKYQAGDVVTADEIVKLADDLELPVTSERIIEALLATGVLVRNESGVMQVAGEVGIRHVFPEVRARKGVAISFDDYAQLVGGRTGKAHSEVFTSQPDRCIDAVRCAHAWTNETLLYSMDNGFEGVPCFWQCEERGHSPLFAVPGTSTTMVHLWTWLNSLRFGIGKAPEDEVPFAKLCQYILGLQRTGERWERGAFSVRGPDDDFAGPVEESLGPCPTIDATAGGVEVLAALLSLPARTNLFPSLLADAAEAALVAGADLLLRTQLEASGAWGIFRYAEDKNEFVPRELSSCLAVQALTALVQTVALETPFAARVQRALSRYVSWLDEQMQSSGDLCWWVPDFTAQLSSETDNRMATLWVCRSLLAMMSIAGDDARSERVRSLLSGAIKFVTSGWTNAPNTLVPVRFRPPTWDQGLSDNQITWNLPRDPLIAATALDYLVQTGQPCSEQWWAVINHAVAEVVGTQEHGHWAHFLQLREGRYYASPGSTKYGVELLLRYLEFWASRTRGAGNVGPA